MRTTLCLALALLPAIAVIAAGEGERVLISKDKDGLAVQGYDVVSYFTDGKPQQGVARYRAPYGGATYQFASEEHLEQFKADPGKYVPAYGGYCGYAASIDRLSPIDPRFFQVLDGRLVLQHNQRALDLWSKDVAGNLVKADQNWPGLVAKNGVVDRGKSLINLDRRGVAIKGYDPVSYFTDGKPAEGQRGIEATYNGALYRFVSQEHRETFERDPAKYVPAFGGYCGYAASINKVSPINPKFFQIIDGRLVLQHTQKAYDLFNVDAKASLAMADANWPALVERNGR